VIANITSRCLNIAYSHVLLSNLKNALALFIRAESLCSSALPSIYATTTPVADAPLKLDIQPNTAKSFHDHLQLLIKQHRGLVELHSFNESSKVAAQKHLTSAAPAVERLDEYPQAGVCPTNLVVYPPKLQPVPVKPLFLDVAWNYIAYPGSKPKVGAKSAAAGASISSAEEEKKAAKKGWFPFGRS
jgi:signal recognition particle subunit SRP68